MFNREKFFDYIINTYLNQSTRFTQGQVYRILYELHKHGMLFHLDDNPRDVGSTTDTGEWMHTFSGREATILWTVQPAFFGIEALPDFHGDPHQICCDLARSKSYAFEENQPFATRTLPRYSFYFEDEPEQFMTGFTEPKTVNGSAVGCPLFSFDQLYNLLTTNGYQFVVSHIQPPGRPEFNHSVFEITGSQGTEYHESDHITIEGEFVLALDGSRFCVYDTSPIGWDLFIDKCEEPNPQDWYGYL